MHGAWADGSCWSGVIERLQHDGYTVSATQFPVTTLEANLARLRQVLNLQSGPTVVVGHSYGCQIMTALGTDAPNAVALVYVAGFGLDEGETIGALLAQGPTPPALANLRIDDGGRSDPSSGAIPRTPSGRIRHPARVDLDLICDWYAEYIVREQSGQEVRV